jgi:SAM-dependent methyltransferase
MAPSAIDRADFLFLMRNAEAAKRLGVITISHLDQAPGLWSYIRIANDIVREAPPGRLLDWGCGYGQMTYLLRRRGLAVTSCDYVPEGSRLPDLPICADLQPVRLMDAVVLPFADGEFDSVLSCGVLGHVEESGGSLPGSLAELRRVLRQRGRLFIYQLPQLWSWQENLQSVVRLAYRHPTRYREGTMRALLERAGFTVERVARANVLPRNLTGLPQTVRDLYARLGRGVVVVDGVLCGIPGFNRLAGSLEIIARSR